jgi:hypothetical protein
MLASSLRVDGFYLNGTHSPANYHRDSQELILWTAPNHKPLICKSLLRIEYPHGLSECITHSCVMSRSMRIPKLTEHK